MFWMIPGGKLLADGNQRKTDFIRKELYSSQSCLERKRYVSTEFLALSVQAVVRYLIGQLLQLRKDLIITLKDTLDPKSAYKGLVSCGEQGLQAFSLHTLRHDESVCSTSGAFFASSQVTASASCPSSIQFPQYFWGQQCVQEKKNVQLHIPVSLTDKSG